MSQNTSQLMNPIITCITTLKKTIARQTNVPANKLLGIYPIKIKLCGIKKKTIRSYWFTHQYK